jgi:hypothetical protein
MVGSIKKRAMKDNDNEDHLGLIIAEVIELALPNTMVE